MLDFIFSTIVFFVAAFYLNRYLDEQGMDKGMSRSMLIFLVASIASFTSSAAIRWVSDEISGKKHVASADPLQDSDAARLLKSLSATHE